MSDKLDMAKLNALPHPLYVSTCGSWYQVHDIDVETGLMRIDVHGMLDVQMFGSMPFKDGEGTHHDMDDFYVEDAIQ